MTRLKVIREPPPGSIVLSRDTPLETAMAHLPLAGRARGLSLRYMHAMNMIDEQAVATFSEACSDSFTAWDLFSKFSDELPSPAIENDELVPEAAAVVVSYAREAASEFGRTGFSGSAALWAAWLMGEHADLSDWLARYSPELAEGQIWMEGKLLGRLPKKRGEPLW